MLLKFFRSLFRKHPTAEEQAAIDEAERAFTKMVIDASRQ